MDKCIAFIEMATVNGLPLLSETERNPMLTTTYGTGELILHAIEQGYREFVIGIGGSATNDAGVGLLQALGARFLDKDGAVLGKGGEILHRIAAIDFSSVHPALKDTRFTIACDVRNPFCGPEGAAHVFARQKGADDTMIEKLDVGMQSFSRLIHSTTGREITHVPGAGAAGRRFPHRAVPEPGDPAGVRPCAGAGGNGGARFAAGHRPGLRPCGHRRAGRQGRLCPDDRQRGRLSAARLYPHAARGGGHAARAPGGGALHRHHRDDRRHRRRSRLRGARGADRLQIYR